MALVNAPMMRCVASLRCSAAGGVPHTTRTRVRAARAVSARTRSVQTWKQRVSLRVHSNAGDGLNADEFLQFLQDGMGLNFGDAVAKVSEALDKQDFDMAAQGLAEAIEYVETRESMANNASEDAAEFATRAAQETDPKRIKFAERAVAAARLNAAEMQEDALRCREEYTKLEQLVRVQWDTYNRKQ